MTDDLINAKNPFAGPELLARAFDRAVLAGRMEASAVSIAMELYKNRVIVNADIGTVEIDGTPLDQAVDTILNSTPIFQTREAAPEIRAQADLEAKALAGNVTAYGQLLKQMGPVAFEAWRIKNNGVQAGRPPKANGNGVNKDNPWTEDTAEARARQVQIIKGQGGPGLAAKLAREAGKTLGGKPLRGM